MLSPGKWHEVFPRDPRKNAEARLKLLAFLAGKPALQRACWEMCRDDLLFWVNLFVIQVDPKQKGDRGKPGPFITYDFQEPALLKMLSWVERGKDGLIEKSRQMGASWMLIILFTWLWLFHPWQTFLFISRNEAAVENEDPNSLFWKLDFILRHLPDWMKPKKFRRRKRFFGNDDHNSFVFGEASTGQANVGGNTTAMGVDEFSQIKEGYEVLHRTSDSTQCRIFNSTHLGLDTAFYELSRRVDMDKLVLHWSQHPIYSRGAYRVEAGRVVPQDPAFEYPADFQFVMDGSPTGGPYPGLRSPWYDDQCVRKGSARAVAMDLDINPSGSVEQFFEALIIRELQAQYAQRPFWEGELTFDEDFGRPRAFVPRGGGRLRLWIHLDGDGPPRGRYVIAGDVSTGQGKTPSAFAILDVSTGEKVGEYVDYETEPTPLAPQLVALCWAFKDHGGTGAKLGWEVPGPGVAFGRKVMSLGYRNVLWRESMENALCPLPTDIPGWVCNQQSKLTLLEQYKDALQSRKFLNRSYDALEECLSFRYLPSGWVEHSGEQAKNSPADARQNHGDRVIGDAIAWKMAKGKQVPPPEKAQALWHPGTLAGRRALFLAERKEAEQEMWL